MPLGTFPSQSNSTGTGASTKTTQRPWDPQIDSWDDPRNPFLIQPDDAKTVWSKIKRVLSTLRIGGKPSEDTQTTPTPHALQLTRPIDAVRAATATKFAFLAINRQLKLGGLFESAKCAIAIASIAQNDLRTYIGAITQPSFNREKIIDELAILNDYLGFYEIFTDPETYEFFNKDEFFDRYCYEKKYDLMMAVCERELDINVRTADIVGVLNRQEIIFSPAMEEDIKDQVKQVGSIIADVVAGVLSVGNRMR